MNQVDVDAVAAAVAAAGSDIRSLRRALQAAGAVSPLSRAEAWYAYAWNTSVRKRRAPSEVARVVLAAARAAGWDGPEPRPASWCARWPRTLEAHVAEIEGAAACEAALAFLRDHYGARA